MIIFLYGKDYYRSFTNLQKIIKRYKSIHKSGINFQFFDLKKSSFSDFFESFQIKAMFQEKKLFLLENVFQNQEFQKNFLKNADFFKKTENIIIFYEKKEISSDSEFFIFLKKNATSYEFKLLQENKLKQWIKNKIKKLGGKISESATELLKEYVGSNLWQMENEIKKLICYCKGKTIQKEDVEILIRPQPQADIFKTIDALAFQRKKIALFLLEKHLEKGDSPNYLFLMIANQFRNLLIIKDLLEKGKTQQEILQRVPLHPYLIKKTISQAQKFSFLRIKEIYRNIFDIDQKIKKGKISDEVGLFLLISKI